MKILEILFHLASGGAERFVVDLSNELSKTNEVVLLTLKDDQVNPEQRQFYKFDLSERVKYMNLGLPDGFHIKSQIAVYKAIKKINPDVVHLNGGGIPKFCALAILMLYEQYRFVQTIHNDLHNGYDKGFPKFLYKQLGSKGKYSCVALSEKNYQDFRDFYPHLNIACIVNGRAELRESIQIVDAKQEMDVFRITKNTRLFIHIARCNRDKNQMLLIDAFNKLKDDGYDVALVIIGAGFESDEGVVLQRKAGQHIHFIGTRKNVADYLYCADIFTLSSVFEGMPISLIEASLAGLPMVSTPVCGSVDLIRDGVNGKLSVDFNQDSYVAALIYSMEHYEELRENAMNMRNDSPYKIEICAKRYVGFFNAGK